MLRLFRNNSPYTVIILFIVALLLRFRVLLHPQIPVAVPGDILYDTLLRWLDVVMAGHAFGYTFLAVVLVFLQALYLNRVSNRARFFYRSSYIPALSYILLISVYPPFNNFSEPLLMNWCLIGGLDIMSRFGQTLHPRKHIFNAGFVLCLAALFQFSGIGFFLLLLLSLVVLRPFNVTEWIVGIVGYLIPIYFFLGILFLVDKLPEIKDFVHLGISLPSQISNPVYSIGMFSGLILLFGGGLFAIQSQVPLSSIYVRRNWVALTIYLIISILVAVLTDKNVGRIWLIVMPPLSLMISQALLLEKSKRFSNFAFYFFLALVVFCQLAIK